MAGDNTATFTDDNFQNEVLKSAAPVVVDFWAEWCQPCKALGPVMDQLAKEFEGRVKIGKLDIDANQSSAARYEVSSIPTVIVFQGGEPVNRLLGLRRKEDFQMAIQKALGDAQASSAPTSG